jgi:hypothetical protein
MLRGSIGARKIREVLDAFGKKEVRSTTCNYVVYKERKHFVYVLALFCLLMNVFLILLHMLT